MEPIQLFVDLFGVSLEHLIGLGGMTYLVVEAAKKRLPEVFKGGYKTMVLAAATAFALSLKMFYPNWETVIVGTILIWLVPEGVHAARSNGGTQ